MSSPLSNNNDDDDVLEIPSSSSSIQNENEINNVNSNNNNNNIDSQQQNLQSSTTQTTTTTFSNCLYRIASLFNNNNNNRNNGQNEMIINNQQQQQQNNNNNRFTETALRTATTRVYVTTNHPLIQSSSTPITSSNSTTSTTTNAITRIIEQLNINQNQQQSTIIVTNDDNNSNLDNSHNNNNSDDNGNSSSSITLPTSATTQIIQINPTPSSSRNIVTIEPVYATISRVSIHSTSPSPTESSSSQPNTSSSLTSTTNTATDTLNHGQQTTNNNGHQSTILTGLIRDNNNDNNSMDPSSIEQQTENVDQQQQQSHSTGERVATSQNRSPFSVTMNLTFNIHQHSGGSSNHHHHHHNNQPRNNVFPVNGGGNGGVAAAGIIPGAEWILDANLMLARQRVYSMLLVRIALLYSVSIPKFLRNIFEYSILLMAFISFALLIHMHVMFIRSPLTCLDHVKQTWPKHGILRVQIGDQQSFLTTINDNFNSNWKNNNDNNTNNMTIFPLTYEQYKKLTYDVYNSDLFGSSSYLKLKSSNKIYDNENKIDFNDENDTELTFLNYKKNGAWSEPYIVEYSLEYGLLRLSEQMRDRYNVPVMKVLLNPETDKCFGDRTARFMLNYFLGHDDVLIGSIKQLAERENNRGFVRNVVTGEHFRFVNVWMTRTSYLAAAFIMIVFTLFVSMLIRYSHQQVFVFVSEFLRSLESQQPVTRISTLATSLITVILALIGMETLMYEFFSDSSITFHVIIMVWAADQFNSLAIQSPITRRHFIRFFYLYQFIFYAYHYRFNGQYSGLALLTTMLFTYHSMIYFFHHFELPLLRATYTQQQRNQH